MKKKNAYIIRLLSILFLGDCLYFLGAKINFSDLVVTGTMPSSTAFFNKTNMEIREKLEFV
jgi:hypothetical protein